MRRVGFLVSDSKAWMGGLNYLKNLVYAISTLEERMIEPVVFMDANTDETVKAFFKAHAKVIETSIFTHTSPMWYLWRGIHKLTGSNALLTLFLKRHRIAVLSHTNLTRVPGITSINWIPDFQHIHLPAMFSERERSSLDRRYSTLIRESDALILSSNSAWEDMRHAFDGDRYREKTHVLHFVSQPYKAEPVDRETLGARYRLKPRFFYLPNQFWKHKNHLTVFKAIRELISGGHQDIQLVCSGHTADHRNADHFNALMAYIREHRLEENIKILGLIDFDDVIALMHHAVCVVNPSLFEGWSSTVEECKSLGKRMILSDIPVHREQEHPACTFFPPEDAHELARLLLEYWNNETKTADQELAADAARLLPERTRAFARRYEEIVMNTLQEEKTR